MHVNIARYTCKSDFSPVIEYALRNRGYTIVVPRQRNLTGVSAMVMAHGNTRVLLGYHQTRDEVEIEVWDEGRHSPPPILDVLSSSSDQLWRA